MRDAPRHKSAPRRRRKTGRGASRTAYRRWSVGTIGVALLTYSLIQVDFSSVYLSKACSDLSRPLPDCLKPPNGAVISPPSY
ncbi:hypothetical protein BKM09_014700 [Pseudomonas amygdali pv. morsprunorum]|nr:hypothetical protein BKM19_002635 [Pseudomonas amygdali pv. morsprunorum]POP89748.1 hypothetical protein CXB39_25330 [Pseudomonas amygdali pv. morsprunorum]POY79887.1 hypothetical protein BKM09_014700 [Pseudomonas amygdali pv. morsprunorum]